MGNLTLIINEKANTRKCNNFCLYSIVRDNAAVTFKQSAVVGNFVYPIANDFWSFMKEGAKHVSYTGKELPIIND